MHCMNIIYTYTHTLDLRVRHLRTQPPPQTHTSDRPIFKIPFDSENLGKFMTSDEELPLISAF